MLLWLTISLFDLTRCQHQKGPKAASCDGAIGLCIVSIDSSDEICQVNLSTKEVTRLDAIAYATGERLVTRNNKGVLLLSSHRFQVCRSAAEAEPTTECAELGAPSVLVADTKHRRLLMIDSLSGYGAILTEWAEDASFEPQRLTLHPDGVTVFVSSYKTRNSISRVNLSSGISTMIWSHAAVKSKNRKIIEKEHIAGIVASESRLYVASVSTVLLFAVKSRSGEFLDAVRAIPLVYMELQNSNVMDMLPVFPSTLLVLDRHWSKLYTVSTRDLIASFSKVKNRTHGHEKNDGRQLHIHGLSWVSPQKGLFAFVETASRFLSTAILANQSFSVVEKIYIPQRCPIASNLLATSSSRLMAYQIFVLTYVLPVLAVFVCHESVLS